MRRFHVAPFWFALLAAAAAAHADTRPLSADRPDRTESPYSVPAGWFQVEADLLSHGVIQGVDESLTGTSVMAFNAKYGLTPRLDVQFVFSPWVRLRLERSGLPPDEDSGTGQAGLRVKLNVTGNDGRGSALAVLPFALFPTRGDYAFEHATWGAVVPIAMALGGERTLSVMTGFQRLDNEETWVIGSFSLGTPIAGDLAGFLEVYVARGGFEKDALDDVTIDAGLTYAAGPDWQLDGGFYRGVTSNSEDWRVFAGASARFSLSSR